MLQGVNTSMGVGQGKICLIVMYTLKLGRVYLDPPPYWCSIFNDPPPFRNSKIGDPPPIFSSPPPPPVLHDRSLTPPLKD